MENDFENVPLMLSPGGYKDFHKWSIDNLSEFWCELWELLGIVCSKKYDKVIDLSVPMDQCPEWFSGALLNYAENLLKYRDDRTALIVASEDQETRKYTFAEMYEQARLYAAAFRKCGLKKGDRVACYMPNREEPIFGMLGAVSMGAIWSGSLPLMGGQAVLSQLKQITPKFLLTIDRFMNDRIEIEMLDKVKDIVKGLPSLEKVIIVPSTNESKLKDISEIKNGCFLDDFLMHGLEENGTVPTMEFEQVSFSHPVMISFTSGSTGKPKAILHGFAILLPNVRDLYLHADIDRDTILLAFSPVGWVGWSSVASLFFCGISVVQFAGTPYYLSPTYFWDMVDEHRITHLILTPKVVEDFINLGYAPREPVEGEYGDLIVAKPSPVFTLGIWGDSEGSLMRKIYYSKYPGKFYIGDSAIVNPITKGFRICGRSDTTLNIRDSRFGSSEVYNVLDKFLEIEDSLCVSHYNKDVGERLVLFLQMKKGETFDRALIKLLQDTIEKELTSFHVPSVILETQEIPYNFNGKKLEIIVKNIINHKPYNKESVANPDSLKNYYNIPELNDEF